MPLALDLAAVYGLKLKEGERVAWRTMGEWHARWPIAW